MVTDCTIRYEQELTEWEEAVEEVEQQCDQNKLVHYFLNPLHFCKYGLPVPVCNEVFSIDLYYNQTFVYLMFH